MAGSHRSHLLLILLLTLTPPLKADYQSGLDAYLIGDYSTAMNDWQAVAAGSRLDETPNIYAEAHYGIAMLYWQGQGTPQDYDQAYDWLLKAAQMNHAGAQAKMGYLYTDGIAVPQDLDQAFKWYSKAARQGDIDGQYNLGIFYLYGWGTEQDSTMAKQYLAAASAQGDQAAEQALQGLLNADVGADQTVGAGHASDKEPKKEKSPARPAPTTPVADDNYVGAGHAGDIEPEKEKSLAWPAPTASPAATTTEVTAEPKTPINIQDKSWILTQNPDHYTLQVIALSTRDKAEALIADFNELTPFAIYTVPGDGRPLHVLLQGSYEELAEARQARDNFPRAIQKTDKLWIRQFAKIQELVRE